jgi:hypothetical protein
MVGSALVGLYVFGERETLAGRDRLYFALGLAGGLLVALSFNFQQQSRGTSSPASMPAPPKKARRRVGESFSDISDRETAVEGLGVLSCYGFPAAVPVAVSSGSTTSGAVPDQLPA